MRASQTTGHQSTVARSPPRAPPPHARRRRTVGFACQEQLGCSKLELRFCAISESYAV
jgi:hypothetical protein